MKKNNVRIVVGGFVREVMSHAARGQWAVTDDVRAGYAITHLPTGACLHVRFRDLLDAVEQVERLASLAPCDLQTADMAAVEAIVAAFGPRPRPGDEEEA